MAVTTEQLDDALKVLADAATVRAAAATLRQRMAPLHVTVLDAFDMRHETPAAQVKDRAIYLMSTDGHCWSVTAEPTQASAFVLTQA